MYPFERLNKIMNTLKYRGQIMIQEDARLFGVSRATLHRDLDQLEQQGLVLKVRGGAILRVRSDLESRFHMRLKAQVEEKHLIAEAAVTSIKDDTSIFLDHSTTVVFLARALAKKNDFKNLLVVTNSLAIPNELSESRGIQVILTGGKVENEFQALSGRWVIEFFRGFNFHQVFASCAAVSGDGFMTQASFIYEILSEIVNSSDAELNILIDSSKFHKIATFRVGPLKIATRIYTSGKPPKAITDKATASGLQLVIAQ